MRNSGISHSGISLRLLHERDAPFMLEWLTDPEITRCFRFEAGQMTMESVLKFIADSSNMDKNANFAITESENDEYLGTVSLKNIDYNVKSAEYAISLRKKAQGKGCGYAATADILKYAFNKLGLKRVYLNVLSDNENAVKFYERFGFVYEGEFLNHIFAHGEVRSLKWFRLTENEYREKYENN